ncbi:arsenate reductase ArsC [Myxococcota bacterium]
MPDQPRHILFLCVHNSARSQMAEGIARSLAPDSVKVSSAGSQPTRVQPLAVQALQEIGIDISGQRVKGLDAIDNESVDLVITLCDDQVCPYFPGRVEQFHWPLDDPAAADNLDAYRRTRDELIERLKRLFQEPEAK